MYALAQKVYEDGIPPQEGEYKNYSYEYLPVSEQMAETHEDGVFKLVSHTGHVATHWQHFWNDLRMADTTKVGTGKPLRDALGTELAGGDFVMSANAGHTTLHLMEVVNFTPKKIRLRDVRSFGSGSTKESKDVIKVDKSLFF